MLKHLSTVGTTDPRALRDALSSYLLPPRAPDVDARKLVRDAESEVARARGTSFRFGASGAATLDVGGRSFRAGRFEIPRIGELRQRAREARTRVGQTEPRLVFHVFDGASPATDIGSLQATAPRGSLFQVASQFNCLEAPSARVVPVADYFFDPTQGPRASMSAFPGTLLRHYAAPAPDGSRFVQSSDGRQINLLDAICEPDVAVVRSGYLTGKTIVNPEQLARALEERFEDLRIGFHEDVEVVFGYDWDGPVPNAPEQTVAQVLTSTLAAGGYGRIDPEHPVMSRVVRQLQRAAHLGTLLAAAAHGMSYVVMTPIGGGVFGNPIGTIWESILWAIDEMAPLLHRDLCVVLNGYAIGKQIPSRTLHEAAKARGGALITFGERSVEVGVEE